jgi:hypothetical protein
MGASNSNSPVVSPSKKDLIGKRKERLNSSIYNDDSCRLNGGFRPYNS